MLRRRLAALLLVPLSWFAGCGSQPSPHHTTAAAPDDAQLRARLDAAIDFTRERVMNTRDHAAWQIIHGILAYKHDLMIEHNGQVVPALEYLLSGGELRGFNLQPDSHGLNSIVEPGSKTGQGHDDQWLGYLSLCGLPSSQTIVWRGQTFTVADLVTQAQWDAREHDDASWTFVGLGTYLPHGTRWKASDGSEWSFDRFMELECRQNINESACGGTHRLSFMSIMLQRHLNEGGKLEGPWKTAHDIIRRHIQIARDTQQADGCFSTDYFVRPGNSPDVATRISTTGHMIEFLSIALTDEEIRQPWLARAVDRLCTLLEQTRDVPVECGGLYHGAHGLRLYRMRRFGGPDVPGVDWLRGKSNTSGVADPPAPQPEQHPVSKSSKDAPPPPPGVSG